MKKLFILFVAALMAQYVFSQPAIDSSARTTKDFYLQKSKSQKTAAWLLLGGGIAASVAGTIIYKNAIEQSDFGLDANPTGGYIALAGILASIGSIPFFISASNNKYKAISVAFTKQKSFVPSVGGFSYRSYPALTLKINLDHHN